MEQRHRNLLHPLTMKTYRALWSLSRSNAVEAIVLQNTIGEIELTYGAPGQYGGSLAGAFPMDKTIFKAYTTAVSDVDGPISIWVQPVSADGFGLVTMANGQYTDQIMQMGTVGIEITVDP